MGFLFIFNFLIFFYFLGMGFLDEGIVVVAKALE